MDDDRPVLLSTLVCDDVLRSIDDPTRLTLHRVVNNLFADTLPADILRLNVVTTWAWAASTPTTHTLRVVILSPDRQTVLAEAATEMRLNGRQMHFQLSTFQGVTLYRPGLHPLEVWLDRERRATYPLVVVGPAGDEEGGA